MKTIFLFDSKTYFKRYGFYISLFSIVAIGIFAGGNARFSLSEDIFENGPYQVGFITAFISLTTIFFSTIFAAQLLFREADARFELLLFSTPIRRGQFIGGRYAALFSLSFFCVLLLTGSFFIGQHMARSSARSTSFLWSYYLYPIALFSFINTLFVTATLSFAGWLTGNKLLVYVNGLLLYVFYMVALIYSGSPLMAQSMPQSEQAQLISAYIDPFGFSAFFQQTVHWSVLQRNMQLVSLSGVFLFNRLAVVVISFSLLLFCAKRFSFIKPTKTRKTKVMATLQEGSGRLAYRAVPTHHHFSTQIRAMLSFAKVDLIYVIKSIPFVLAALALLFAVGMEMYAEIEKGIRIPQKYASSGLMVSTIIQNFHLLCLIAVLYYVHELFWRSRNTNFYLVENSTAHIQSSFPGKWLALTVVIVLLTLLMILEGIAFQILYKYPLIEWRVYASVLLFASLPLVLLGGFLLLVQKAVHQKYIGLGLTALLALVMATPAGKHIISFPLLKCMQPFSMDYSDMNGWGMYTAAYGYRLLFGLGVFGVLLALFSRSKAGSIKWRLVVAVILWGGMAAYAAAKLLDGYQTKDEAAGLQAQASYEKLYRSYQNLPQPTITAIQTRVDLFPEENVYTIKGVYVMENKSRQDIHKVLVNFGDDFIINKAILTIGKERIPVQQQYQLIALQQALLPGQQARFEFDIRYSWKAVNGHRSFNAIVDNGSFMRISRYYPRFGYMTEHEIQDEAVRKQFRLGSITPLKAFDAPKSPDNDRVNLDMVVSTSARQTAIGVGELTGAWKAGNRNYFQYKTNAPIPFRFGLSSARYAVKREVYKGRRIEIYYHPAHHENVDHLLTNIKITLDYCEANFGPYPFRTIRFAEVSGFTKGFAATAYPATIYMTEDVVFHANIKGDQQQDVINELAGHELSHLWWGNTQVSPDDRAGAVMLTETFAMYTEMMLLQKMYGKKKMLERIKMHLGIYNAEKGFTEEEPLYKVKGESAHISYSKGAVVMYRLSEMIGEDKVNRVLKNFLDKNRYPAPKPITMDFMDELFKVADKKFHPEIKKLFMEVTDIAMPGPVKY